MRVERSRLSFLAGAAAFVALSRLPAGDRAGAAALPEVVVYKSPTCGCCTEWVAHLRRHGFRVRPEDVTDPQAVKTRHRVPPDLQSCHTALVDGFVQAIWTITRKKGAATLVVRPLFQIPTRDVQDLTE